MKDRTLFFVNTPMQLFNAIVLRRTLLVNNDCDVYYSEELNYLFENTEINNIFNNCYGYHVLDDILSGNSKIVKIVNKIINYFRIGEIQRTIPSDVRYYKQIFISGVNYRIFELYYAIKKINHKIILNIYEEGINEYYYYGKHLNKYYLLFDKLFFCHSYMEVINKIYLYCPDVAIKNVYGCGYERIPSFLQLKDIKESLNKIYKYKFHHMDFEKNTVFFLDQEFNGVNDRKDKMDYFQAEVIHFFIEKCGESNVWIKLHPRSKKLKYGDRVKYFKYNYPLELIALNEALGNLIFVSICSSAVLNFKLMFNYEPRIISCNRIVMSDELINRLFSNVKDICELSNFYQPENIEEFKKAINSAI